MTTAITGRAATNLHLSEVVLAAYSPAADGLARWIAVDLDATAGHGDGGLVDPAHAARCIAERAHAAGLGDGLLVARSRSGAGRHVWLMLPEPTTLADATLAVAYLAVQALKVADDDVAEYECAHAFRTGRGGIAEPGQPGAVELYPRAEEAPRLGWALTLPGAGAFADRSGGIIINPFSDQQIAQGQVPHCDAVAWQIFLRDARAAEARVARQQAVPARSRQLRRAIASRRHPVDLLERIDPRTRDFLDGKAIKPGRNAALFASMCNLIGVGIDPYEAERLALGAALRCGLTEREARNTIRSAIARRAAGR